MCLFLLFNIIGAQATQGHQAFSWGVELPSASIGDNTATPGAIWLDHGEGACNDETLTTEHLRLSESLEQRGRLGNFVFHNEPVEVKVWFAAMESCASR